MSQAKSPHSSKPLIVQVAGFYPPHLGGSEVVAQALAEGLAERGYPVRVIAADIVKPRPETQLQSHLDIRWLRAFEFAHTAFAPGAVRELLGLPRHSIIHLHLQQAYYPELVLFASKLRRIPYVVHFHLDLQPTGLFGKLFLLYKHTLLRAVIKNADRIIVFSETQQVFIHEVYGVDKRRIDIIPNGVGGAYFAPPCVPSSKKRYELLYLGRLSAQKRVHLLIEALPHLKTPVTLTLIGDGEERIKLETRASELGLTNVRFAGQKPAGAVIPYYRRADAYVIASENEGMPLAVLEAMASGLPIVAARVPGLTELVGGVGVLIDNPSGQTFARALDRLLDHPERLAELSRKSTEAAQHYSWPQVIDTTEAMYRKVEQL